jgi:hypothetical protein
MACSKVGSRNQTALKGEVGRTFGCIVLAVRTRCGRVGLDFVVLDEFGD